MTTVPKTQFLSQPDGNIAELMTDPRVYATAAGAIMSAVIEKELFRSQRGIFGVASLSGGSMKFYPATADGKADTAAGPNPSLGMNRQLARLGLVVGSVAAIENVPSGTAQYAFLGVAALALAHIAQDMFPMLGKL